MTSWTPPRPTELHRHVLFLDWDNEFIPWSNGKLARVRGADLTSPWAPGQHVAMIGKTREGKSNMAVAWIEACRKYVLALDPKGLDETLSKSGWTRISGVPPHAKLPKDEQQALDEGRPVKLIAGIATRTKRQDEANRALMSHAIEYAGQAGGWTLLVDEHQVLTDQRMFRLGPDIARMAISAARDKTSVVVNMQFPSWVEQAPNRQATLLVMWRTGNRDLIKRTAEAAGRDWHVLGQVVDQLPKYHALVIPDELRAPMMITKPPKL